tara:strand:- start:6476 stop:7360 length:885 start_codon:yes stop_codon:yes gene_type:complete
MEKKMEDSKVLYEIMLCADGVSRAVPFINGNKIDPSIGKVEQEEKEQEEMKPKKVISIQDRIINQVETFISAIESKVDDFVDNDFKSNYDCYQHLLDMGCKSIHARKMRQLYLNCFNDLVDVYNGEDEYLNEAWGHLKPQYHKKMMDFYGVIVDDIDRLIKNSTAQRKPRKVKTKSSSRLINKLKYQVEFNKLKLVSINPEKIIGAKELWVYNTKSNKLGVYYAQNSIRGFSVKGCTIQHFDEESSIQKTARKPKDALGSLTKRSLNKKLKEMKTKDQILTGRINAQTILLGAF